MKVDRYWTKDTLGEDIEVVHYRDDNGKYLTGKLLRIMNGIRTGVPEYRTQAYYAERSINPSSKTHKGTQSTKVDAKYSPRLGKYATQRKMNAYGQTAIARDINNVKKRRG